MKLSKSKINLSNQIIKKLFRDKESWFEEEYSFNEQLMNINKLNAKKVFSLIEQRKLNWNAVQTVFTYLKLLLMKLDGDEYVYWLKYLAKLISLGYGSLVLNETHLQKRLVHMFNLSFKSFIMDQTNKNFSYTIFQISVIADLVRSFPTTMYPYNKDFIQNTIKLAQFTGRNKESQNKLSMVISILYLNFAQKPELYLNQGLSNDFKHHIFNRIKKAQKQQKYQEYEILCKTFENFIKMNNIKIKVTKDYSHGYTSHNYQFFQKPSSSENKSFNLQWQQYTKEK